MTEKKAPRRRNHKKKPTEKAIMGQIVTLMDPDGGELIKCIVPAYLLDKRAMNDRGLRVGDFVLMDVFKDRNPRFWRLFHALSGFVAENVEDMNGLRHHDALKKLQLDGNIYCQFEIIEPDPGTAELLRQAGLPVTGWHKRVAKSLNFDDTDETEAAQIWEELCDYVAKTYFAGWDSDTVAQAADHWADNR